MAANSKRRTSSTPAITSDADRIIAKATRADLQKILKKGAKKQSAPQTEFRVRKLLTPAQVQKTLEVSESWLKRSDIPFLKLGRLRRYDATVVEAYLAARDMAA